MGELIAVLSGKGGTGKTSVCAGIAESLALLGEKGYDPVYGARPLKRYLQRHLESAIAKSILSGNFEVGDTLRVVVKENGLSVEKA